MAMSCQSLSVEGFLFFFSQARARGPFSGSCPSERYPGLRLGVSGIDFNKGPGSGTGCDVGATVPMAVEKRGLPFWSAFRDRLRGASAPPTHSRWAAYALSLGFRVCQNLKA